jgi:hypothetical protein
MSNLTDLIAAAKTTVAAEVVTLPWERVQRHVSGMGGIPTPGIYDRPQFVAINHLAGWLVSAVEIRDCGQTAAQAFINSDAGAYETRRAEVFISAKLPEAGELAAEMMDTIGGPWYLAPSVMGLPMQMPSGDAQDVTNYGYVDNYFNWLVKGPRDCVLSDLRGAFGGSWDFVGSDEFMWRAPTPKGSKTWRAADGSAYVMWTA